MAAYLARRTLLAALTMAVISFFSFVIIQLPEGDYVDWYVENQGKRLGYLVTDEEKNMMRADFGLDQPLVVQYWDWISKIVFEGDFGYAIGGGGSYREPINALIMERLPATVALTSFTIVLTWTFAIPIGIYSAMRQHSVGDYTFTFLGFTGLAVPDFLLGLVLMYFFFAYFDMSVGGLFSGRYESLAWECPSMQCVNKGLDLLWHLVIPAIVLGTSGTAGLIRVMRNNLLDELQKPYVVTARAKGLAGWKVVAKYPVRIAFNPFVSSIGYMLPALVGGSIIVSVVLSLPTLGPLLLVALRREDMFLASAIILLLAGLTVIGTLISDLLLVVVDPRIKLTGSGS